jgi:lambda family phage tail tape measure protein
MTTMVEFFADVGSAIALSAQNLGTAVNQALHGNLDDAQQFASQSATTLHNGLALAFEKADISEAVNEGFAQGLKDVHPFEDAVAAVFETATVKAKQAAQEAAKIAAVDLDNTPIGGGLGLTPTEPVKKLQGLDEVLHDLEEQKSLLALNNREREVQNDLLRIEHSLRQQNIELTEPEKADLTVKLQELQVLRDQADALDAITGPQQAYETGLAATNQLLADNKISTAEANKALQNLRLTLLQTQNDFASGFESGFIEVSQHLNDFASGAEALVVDAFGGMEDALTAFARTGELSFEGLTNAILDDLARIASQKLVLELFNAIAPGAGSAGSALASIFGGGFAEGGHVSAGKTFLVGEEGPELFQPPQSGNIVPAKQTAAAMSGAAAPEVNVRIVNVTDPDEVAGVFAGSRGDDIIMNVVRRNRGKIRRELS